MTDDEQRKRLAYADRAETLERNRRRLLPDGHLGECVLSVDDGWRCAIGCREAQLAASQLADGTGRHSRNEMEQARPEATYRPFARPWPCTRCGAAADRDCTYIAGAPMAGDYGPEIHVERLTPEDPTPVVSSAVATVVAGVSFTSVPQLCAAYEYALEMLKRLYLMTDRKQHAWQPEQETMLEARALLLAAGKEVL